MKTIIIIFCLFGCFLGTSKAQVYIGQVFPANNFNCQIIGFNTFLDTILIVNHYTQSYPQLKIDTLKYRYFSIYDNSYLELINKNISLNNCFIERFDLVNADVFDNLRFNEEFNKKKIISNEVNLDNCIISNANLYKVEFSKKILFQNILILNNISFNECIFSDICNFNDLNSSQTNFYKCKFDSTVNIVGRHGTSYLFYENSTFKIAECQFYKNINITFFNLKDFIITNSYIFSINVSNIYVCNLEITKNNFGVLTESAYSVFSLQYSKIFDKSNFYYNVFLNNVFIRSCIFNINSFFNNCTFTRHIYFHDLMYIDNPRANITQLPDNYTTNILDTLSEVPLLTNSYFSDTSYIVSTSFNDAKFMENIKIKPESYENVAFYFKYPEYQYPVAKSIFFKHKQQVFEDTSIPEALKNRILTKLDFELFLHEIREDIAFNQHFEFAWKFIVLNTVRNGYKGFLRFFVTSGVIILIFAMLYMFTSWRYQILALIHLSNTKDKNDFKAATMNEKIKFKDELNYLNKKPYAKNFVMKKSHKYLYYGVFIFSSFVSTIWFSTKVFASIKYKEEFLHTSHGLKIIILIEYIVGLFMLTMFVLYLAPNLPIIRTLLSI